MADEKETVKVEIILDDGSVEKGFMTFRKKAKETAEDSAGYFSNVMDAAEGSVGDFIGALKNVPASFVAIGAAAAAVGATIHKAFELAIEGERIDAIYNQFDLLAMRAGIAGDSMRESLETAAGGFVDFEGVVKTANIALGEMGKGAERLPELLMIARQAAILNGGSVQDYFETLNRAVLSGNTKALKTSMNLFVDAEGAIEKYSKSHDQLKGNITEAGRRQALLNAIIDQAKNSYAGVDATQRSVSLSQQKLSTSIGEIGDAMAKLAQTAFGDILREFAFGFADFVNTMTGLAPESQTKIRQLDEQIGKINESIKAKNEFLAENAREREGIWQEIFDPQVDPRFIQAKLDDLNKELAKKLAERQAILNANKPVEPEAEFKIDPKQIAERNAQMISIISAQNAAEIALAESKAMAIADVDQRRLAMSQVFLEQEAQIRIEQAQKLADIDKTFTAENGYTQEQAQAARLAVVETYNAKVEQAHMQNAAKLKQIAVISADQLKSIWINGLSQSLQQVGQNLQKGVGLFDQFGAGIVSIVGDMMISIGTALLTQGKALEVFIQALNTLLPGAGWAAAAAGAALIIFGSALKASVASKSAGAASSSTPTAPSISAGGTATGETTGTEPTIAAIPAESRERRADTTIQFIVQGDIFDSDTTGTRMVELINSSFDKTGVTIRKGAVA